MELDPEIPTLLNLLFKPGNACQCSGAKLEISAKNALLPVRNQII